ncbi:hypothetical protein [Roseateles koreensis]|uniref:Nickel transport protein n=1 Tax=Roseateles koreensis TaxID=2987526 RepID=A0ABT5KWB6_9BURK|nr:hypothetical protein [Roseateles koreensis]MDC8786111.1 hypothetical protein [Roseateles koreensis]
MKKILIAGVLAGGVLATSLTWAHGGEDHGEHVTAPAQRGLAPRATAQTDDFELVLVLTGTQATAEAGSAPPHPNPDPSPDPNSPPVLTLYLDRFATNAPVDGATVEVESGAFKAVAKPVAPGVYAVAGQPFAKPGRYPLTVSVQTSDAADLLDATLQYEAPPSAVAVPATALPWRKFAGWAIGSALMLIFSAGVWRHRPARA